MLCELAEIDPMAPTPLPVEWEEPGHSNARLVAELREELPGDDYRVGVRHALDAIVGLRPSKAVAA